MLYDEVICDFGNLYRAYRLAHRGKSEDPEVIEFDMDKSNRLHGLLRKLKEKRWDEVFFYYRFTIRRPKVRVVDALTFEGRIVQHVLCDLVLRPYLERRLIESNCACRIGKGTEYAARLAKEYMVKASQLWEDPHVLKADIRKYFPSIDRETLEGIVDYPDESILELLRYIIRTCPDDNGLPIGNQTSQWFALYYLDSCDREIKERNGIRFYVRYMDDFIAIAETKEELSNLKSRLSDYLMRNRKLEFNGKTKVSPLRDGFSFLGWRYNMRKGGALITIPHDKLKDRKSKVREMGNLDETERKERLVSLRSFLSFGNVNRRMLRWTRTIMDAKLNDMTIRREKRLCQITRNL